MYKISGDTVRFFYERENLFDNCSLRSGYMAKGILDGEGKWTGEDLALCSDDQEAFGLCVAFAAGKLFGLVEKMAVDGKKGLVADDDILLTFRYKGAKEAALKVIDTAITECLVSGCLSEWFGLRGTADSGGWAQRHALALQSLWAALFALRRAAAY